MDFIKAYATEIGLAVTTLCLLFLVTRKYTTGFFSRLARAWNAFTADRCLVIYWKKSYDEDIRFSWSNLNRTFLDFIPKLYTYLVGKFPIEQRPTPTPPSPPKTGPLTIADELAAKRKATGKEPL